MEDNSRKQPLLGVSIDPVGETQNVMCKYKRRFRRCQSLPTADAVPEVKNADTTKVGPKSIFDGLRPNLRRIVVIFAVYLVASTLVVYLVRQQMKGEKTDGILDALYFTIVTMTTVGYGDLVPDSMVSKLMACGIVLTGMVVVGFLLSEAADHFAERQEELVARAFHIGTKVSDVGKLNDIRTNRVKYKLLVTAIYLLVLVTFGTAFLWTVEKMELVDSFYCVCSTITTLGYGDKTFSTEIGRAFAVVWMVAGTICVAQLFLYIAELAAERRQQSIAKWVLRRRLTYVDLQAADFNCDGNVSAPEFIIYKLKELGKISQEDIAVVLEEFEDLDIDRSGSLTRADLSIP